MTGVAFRPNFLSGLQWWVDASRIAGTQDAVINPVPNLSPVGASADATQATSSQRATLQLGINPITGGSVAHPNTLKFDGPGAPLGSGHDMLYGVAFPTGDGDHTVICVVMLTGTWPSVGNGDFSTILGSVGGTTTGAYRLYSVGNETNSLGASAGFGGPDIGGRVALGGGTGVLGNSDVIYRGIWRKNSTTWNIEWPQNVTATKSDTSTATGTFNGILGSQNTATGASTIFAGYLAEIMYYSRRLTDYEIAIMKQYLDVKWAVGGTP